MSQGKWKMIVEAVRGRHRADYTEGDIGRALLLLAIPMVLEVALESTFAVVNAFWLGRLGKVAIATVGITEVMNSVIFALGMGLGIGASALVARRIGEKDPDGAARTAVQAIILGVLVAIPISVLGAVYSTDLLLLMDAEPEVVAHGGGYTRVLFGGNIFVFLLFLINAIFRGAGDAAISMRALWLANACNLALDPLFIFGLGSWDGWGVTGAAIATTTARGIGVAYQIWRLSGRSNRFRIERAHLRLDPAILKQIFALSGTGTFQILVGMASWIGLVRIVAGFGSEALAGYTLGIRIVIFGILPAWGLSNAAATMVGQSLGAGKPERAEQAVWKAGFYNLLFLGSLGLVLVAFAPWILRAFTDDPDVLPIATSCLRLVSAGFPFYAYGMVLTSAFNGAGDTWTPTWLNIVCFWLFEIPLAWFLAHACGLGPAGVFISIGAAFSSLAVASIPLFRRGRWKSKRV